MHEAQTLVQDLVIVLREGDVFPGAPRRPPSFLRKSPPAPRQSPHRALAWALLRFLFQHPSHAPSHTPPQPSPLPPPHTHPNTPTHPHTAIAAEVVDVKDFGAVVKIARAKEALLHISELTHDPQVSVAGPI